MCKTTIVVILIVLTGVSLFAQTDVVIREVSGKVEIRLPEKSWQPAAAGMRLPIGAYISTGVNSLAVMEVGPSVLRVKQLTRVQLQELVQQGGTLTTSLNLPVGKVSAEVKSMAGLKNDFKLRSPVSTAAVRGTRFDFDGYKLVVMEGLVRLVNQLQQARNVAGGEDLAIAGYEQMANGEGAKTERVEVAISSSPAAPPPPAGTGGNTGGIVIKF
jgi:hypothetical protein